MYLDGRKLKLWENVDELAPELAPLAANPQRRARVEMSHEIVPLTNHEALVWCIKTQIPECLRGYLLDTI